VVDPQDLAVAPAALHFIDGVSTIEGDRNWRDSAGKQSAVLLRALEMEALNVPGHEAQVTVGLLGSSGVSASEAAPSASSVL
jgi:hypothetical protein